MKLKPKSSQACTGFIVHISGNSVFAGISNGIFLSIDSGTSWVAANTGLTNQNIQCLAVNGGSIFAGVWNNNSNDTICIFRSTNNGASWEPVNIRIQYVTSLAQWGTTIFAASAKDGVFLSTDGGNRWEKANTGLADTRVLSLTVSGTDLCAGTQGSSVWRVPLSDIVRAINPQTQSPSPLMAAFSDVHQIIANHNLKVVFFLPRADHVTIKIFNLFGVELATLFDRNFEAGIHKAMLNTANVAAGFYVVKMQTEENAFVRYLTILR
jgi:hypothetical protein